MKVRGNHFHESTLVSSLQSEIRVTIEFPMIFGKTNFVEAKQILWKSPKSTKFVALKKGALRYVF